MPPHSPFSLLLRGTAATDTVQIPMPWGEDMAVGVRVLNGLELGQVLSRAREYAIAGGVKEPKEGDELYVLGQMANTLAVACCKPGEPSTPFFASAEEVLSGLDHDRIALLYEHQQMWQDKCGVRNEKIAGGDFFAKVLELAGWQDGQPDPLRRWRPSRRMIFMHTLAAQYMTSLASSSPTSSPSGQEASS